MRLVSPILRQGRFLIAINATGFGDERLFSCSSPLFLLTERLTGCRPVAVLSISVAHSGITDRWCHDCRYMHYNTSVNFCQAFSQVATGVRWCRAVTPAGVGAEV